MKRVVVTVTCFFFFFFWGLVRRMSTLWDEWDRINRKALSSSVDLDCLRHDVGKLF